jgi:hypothetical protein
MLQGDCELHNDGWWQRDEHRIATRVILSDTMSFYFYFLLNSGMFRSFQGSS